MIDDDPSVCRPDLPFRPRTFTACRLQPGATPCFNPAAHDSKRVISRSQAELEEAKFRAETTDKGTMTGKVWSQC